MTIGVIGESLVNVAIGIARLGMSAHLFTTIGDDERGAVLLSQLAAEGVAVGRSVAPWPPLDALHFGSLGSVVGPDSTEVASVVDRYRGTALISYDPDWRDGIVESEPRTVVEANASRADIVKLSADDAAAIYPGVALEAVAHAVLELGPALVVITKGADGASAWTRNVVKHAAAAPAEVVDTVGAGEAFMATLLSELAELSRDKVAGLNKRELELVVDFASYVAARTCERVGADIPHISEIPF